MKVVGRLFKRAICCDYQQVVSKSMQVLATQMASEKVTNMVGTFLNESNNGSLYKRAIGCTYQQVVSKSLQVHATPRASEKVDATVTTFLNFDS